MQAGIGGSKAETMGFVSNSAASRGSVRWLILMGCVLVGLVVVAALLIPHVRYSHPDKLILISIDTLRPDHLGYAGYHRDTSPAIDRLAARSLDFRNAFTHATTTLPSHATMFTSLYPSMHKAVNLQRGEGGVQFGTPLADGHTTLAEILQATGYRTAAFVEGGQLSKHDNLGQGFEVYDVHFRLDGRDVLDEILERARQWIAEHREEPFFCFVHSYVVHSPWTPRPPYDRMFDEGYDGALPSEITAKQAEIMNASRWPKDSPEVQHVVSLYDGEIRYMDDQLGAFLERLAEMGIDEETILVFTSDHGEEWAERGQVGRHGHSLYDELLRVPLLLRVPGVEPHRIDRQVRLIDLAPTVLALLGIDPGDVPFRGENLLPDGVDSQEDLPLFCEILHNERHLAALRTGSQKVLFKLPGYQAHYLDLEADPEEKAERDVEDSPEAAVWLKRLQDIMADNREFDAPPVTMLAPDPRVAEQLRALGYIR